MIVCQKVNLVLRFRNLHWCGLFQTGDLLFQMREMREERIFRVLHCCQWCVEVGLISSPVVNAAELPLRMVYGGSVFKLNDINDGTGWCEIK